MAELPAALEERVRELVRPTRGDIVRAKQAALARLADGAARTWEDVVYALADDVGVPRYPTQREKLNVQPGENAAASVDVNDVAILRPRFELAGKYAVAELAAEGLLVEVERNIGVRVGVQYGGLGTSTAVATGVPKMAEGYELTLRMAANVLPIVDVDLFTADLEGLKLDDRALLCVREALEAFRRGLWLSCVSLLGAVSEGAWWRLAESMRGSSAELDRMLEDDRTSAAALIRETADELGRRKGLRTVAAELHSHATYLRELRNYGIHPRAADPEASQEHAFTEAGCALLLLSTHRYLERLASVSRPPE